MRTIGLVRKAMGPPRGRGAKAPGLGSRPDQGPRAPLQRAPWQGKFLPRAATSLGRFHSQPVLKNNYRSRSHHGENRHEKKATHLRVAKVQSLGGILLRSINKCFYEWFRHRSANSSWGRATNRDSLCATFAGASETVRVAALPRPFPLSSCWPARRAAPRFSLSVEQVLVLDSECRAIVAS